MLVEAVGGLTAKASGCRPGLWQVSSFEKRLKRGAAHVALASIYHYLTLPVYSKLLGSEFIRV